MLRPGFYKHWTLESIWLWLYSIGVSEELRAWSFIHTSLTLYLAVFCLFLAINIFEEFWMENFCKKTQLMLELLKGPFLSLRFSYSTLTTRLMMPSIILLSMLMILLSTLIVIRKLICGCSKTWPLNMNLTFGHYKFGVEVD